MVLSKLKTLNYYHEFYHSSLYCAKLVLNANMSIYLVCRITEIRRFTFRNLNMHMYFDLIRMVETLRKTNSIVFMSLHDYANIISTLSTFSLLMSKEELRGKFACLFSFRLGHHFSLSGWLIEDINKSKKGPGRGSLVAHVSQNAIPSFCVRSKF